MKCKPILPGALVAVRLPAKAPVTTGVDFYVINGSDEGRFLDTVRNTAKNFASTVSLASTAKHKVIIIDEADNTTNDVQLLLRASIEEFSGNCRFIFTCNYKNRIIEPLHSRCSVIEFGIKGRDKQTVAATFFKRLGTILEAERVEYDPKVIAQLVNKHFPDWRRVLNECQRYSAAARLSAILASFSDVPVNELIKTLRTRISRKFESGLSPTWIMILVSCVVFTMLFMIPWFRVLFLLLCLYSSISGCVRCGSGNKYACLSY